jgi:hypothetical protein
MNIQEPKENPGLTEIPAEPEKPGKIIRLAQKNIKRISINVLNNILA